MICGVNGFWHETGCSWHETRVIISTRGDEYGDKPVKSGGSGCSPRGCKDDEKGIDSTQNLKGKAKKACERDRTIASDIG